MPFWRSRSRQHWLIMVMVSMVTLPLSGSDDVIEQVIAGFVILPELVQIRTNSGAFRSLGVWCCSGVVIAAGGDHSSLVDGSSGKILIDLVLILLKTNHGVIAFGL